MKRYKANIALIAVISMIAISLAGGFALSVSSVNYKLSTIGFIASTNIEQQIHTCKEEAFRKISKDLTYVGSNTINFTLGSCTFIIAINGTNSNYRDVTLNANYSDYYKSEAIKIDTVTSPISEL